MIVKLALAGVVAFVLSTCEQPTAADYAPTAAKTCVPPQIVLRKPGINYPPNATYQSNGAPPLRFRGDRSVQIQFASPDEVERLCGVTKPICGFRLMACARGNKLIMPNPCGANSIVEPYGKLLCHEMAHANGWPAYHGD